MEVMEQITIDQWMRWKEDIRRKLGETARNFVYIGFRLRQIRDSGMYGGARDIFEFAMKEYGLSDSTVCRFIAINERFSEGGNSLELKAEYRGMSSSKLTEMLALTDEECRMITEKTTVVQIRELKKFNRQGPEEGERQEGQWTPLQKCIIEYFRGKKEMLDAAIECIAVGDNKRAAEIISPNGNTTCKKGIIFLFMYDYKDGVKYKTFGSSDITVMSWDDFILDISEIFWPDYSMGINGYNALYKEPEPEPEKVKKTPELLNREEVATSQQEGKGDEDDVEKMKGDEAPKSGTEEEGMEDDPENMNSDTDSENEWDSDGYEEIYIETQFLLKNMENYYNYERWDEFIETAEKVIRNAEKMKKREGE